MLQFVFVVSMVLFIVIPVPFRQSMFGEKVQEEIENGIAEY